jgi:hypothetical protein
VFGVVSILSMLASVVITSIKGFRIPNLHLFGFRLVCHSVSVQKKSSSTIAIDSALGFTMGYSSVNVVKESNTTTGHCGVVASLSFPLPVVCRR